ncbi:DUF1851 domain-containing protein [Actinoplanes sp. NBC_00393]|uniref:T6SS immunity protein Tdi1 domain-containing protein n=1 Tax=Actinoplanes sp. NBC_00393 TaxID=2975953 RepID=UPI002E23078A
MFKKFLRDYRITDRLDDAGGEPTHPQLAELFRELGGTTFDDGLYRIHTPVSAAAADALCARLIEDFVGEVFCFGFDWLGRNLALDVSEGGDGLVVIVEPGAGELLEGGVTLSKFHEKTVRKDPTALAAGFFAEWRAGHPEFERLSFEECVGYKVPLFLGGDDEVHNLEVVPYDVYWEICVQLRTGTRQMRAGTSIRQIVTDSE